MEPIGMAFCKDLLKVETHAHLNGSVSNETILKLRDLKLKSSPELQSESTPFLSDPCTCTGRQRTLRECFQIFDLLHSLVDNREAVFLTAKDVIQEFADDNVKYLELRTTPRAVESTGMTEESYVESVLEAIRQHERDETDIVVRLILSVDRKLPLHTAWKTLKLAQNAALESNGIVVGLDLSGNPKVGDARTFIPVFEEARNLGLKLSLHLAEVPNIEETSALLTTPPDRIGHGTCLLPNDGGSEELVEIVRKKNTPLELCLSSNVKVQTVPSFDNHHFKYWYDLGHPCLICTDDKGVFETSLSHEYQLVSETFSLSEIDMWRLSYASIDHTFADVLIKNRLKDLWKTHSGLNLK